MSVIGDFAGKITDLVVAPAVVTANVGAGLFHLGVEATAWTTQVGARLLEPFAPAGRPLWTLNREVGARAEEERRQAFDLAFKGLKQALSELKDEDFDHLDDDLSPGFNQLAADTAVGPAASMLLWPFSTVVDFFKGAGEIGPVRDNVDLWKRLINAVLDTFSVSGEHTRISTVDLRDHFLALTIGPGGAVVNDVIGLLEGSLRLGMGNGQKLAKAIKAGIEAMEYPVQYRDVGKLAYPDIPISDRLYEAAKVIVDNQPKQFIAALEREDPLDVVRAALEEPEKLLTFFFYYQWALVQVVQSVVDYLSIGLRDVNDVEAYVLAEDELFEELKRVDRIDLEKDDPKTQQHVLYKELKLRGKKRPFTITEFEFYAGNAKSKTHKDDVAHLHPELPHGPFAQATINYAQETVFSYSSLLLQERDKAGGRDKALDRVQRLYGQAVRERIERDPSLKVIRFRKGLGEEMPETDLDKFIEKELDGEKKAVGWEEYYEERIQFLQDYRNDPDTILFKSIEKRIDYRIAILEEALRKLRLKAQESAEKKTRRKRLPAAKKASAAG